MLAKEALSTGRVEEANPQPIGSGGGSLGFMQRPLLGEARGGE